MHGMIYLLVWILKLSTASNKKYYRQEINRIICDYFPYFFLSIIDIFSAFE